MLSGMVDIPEGQAAIQRDMDMFKKWINEVKQGQDQLQSPPSGWGQSSVSIEAGV